MNNPMIYHTFVNFGQLRYPGFKVRYKDETGWMRVVGWLVKPFNPKFMTLFTTVVGKTVYFPSKQALERDYQAAWKTLAHEFVHLEDRKRFGILFDILYAAPQVFCLPAVLVTALLEAPWWCYLFSLGLLAPLPAFFRARFELRGYTMSMAVNHWRYGSVREYTQTWIAERFTGPSYYFMWPFSKSVRGMIQKAKSQLTTGRLLERKENLIFVEVFKLLRSLGLVEEG